MDKDQTEEKVVRTAYETIGAMAVQAVLRNEAHANERERLENQLNDAYREIDYLTKTEQSARDRAEQYRLDACKLQDKLDSMQYEASIHNTTSIQRGMQQRINALWEKLNDNADDCDWETLDAGNPLYNLHKCDASELRLISESKQLAAVKAYGKRTGETLRTSLDEVRKAGAIHGYYF